MLSIRSHMGLAAILLAITLTSGVGEAATADKKSPSMSWDNPTVGVFGAHRGTSEAGHASAAGRHHAGPPAPIAAVPPPKVEAEQPNIPNTLGGPTSLPAAPRPEAGPEGPAVGMPASIPHAFAGGPEPTGFLANHPFVSGLVAGLVGTDLGSLFYGGPMQGDETGAFFGFFVRLALFAACGLLVVKLAWRRFRPSDDGGLSPLVPARREPSFGRPAEDSRGRREPTLHREPSFESEPSFERKAGEPTLSRGHEPLAARDAEPFLGRRTKASRHEGRFARDKERQF